MIVSQIFLDAFHELKMAYPKTTEKRRQEFIALGAANFAAGVTGE